MNDARCVSNRSERVEKITGHEDGADESAPDPRLPQHVAGDLTDIPSVSLVAKRRYDRFTILLEEIAGYAFAILRREQHPEERLRPARWQRGRTVAGHAMLLALISGQLRPLQRLSTAERASFSARTPAGSS